MQNVLDAASNAASTVAAHATNLATTAADQLGLSNSSAPSLPHSQAHEHKSPIPPDSEIGPVKKMDAEGLAVFEADSVRHAVLVKINQLAIDDVRHGLKEVTSLELYVDGGNKKGISYYHPLRYFTVTRPMGIDYIGEVEIEEGKSIHVRCHKRTEHAHASFHSIDTRPSEDGGAVFKTGEPLGWFDY